MNVLNPFEHFISEARAKKPEMDLDSKLRSKEQLAILGLPTRKEEAWRNTSLKFLSEKTFIPVTAISSQMPIGVSKLIERKKIENTHRLTFINGFYAAELSSVEEKDIFIDQKKEMKTQSADDVSNVIQSLNDIYNLNPVEITIKSSLSKPIQIFNITDGSEILASPKVKMVLKANNEAKVVITHIGQEQACYLSNGHFIFDVEKDARLELINYINQSTESYHFDNVQISAASASIVKYFELNFNALMTRHNFRLDLNGEHIQSHILGASYLNSKQHCDSQTFINHNQSHSQSEQIYKALLDDQSHSVFAGTVYIAQGIVKADSAQLNQNLLLSKEAEVNSKPILRIFSNDVKASHGSTMGQIQEEEIFYLQSRSISRVKAIELLGHGFLNEIILRIESPVLRSFFTNELLSELGQHQKPPKKVLE